MEQSLKSVMRYRGVAIGAVVIVAVFAVLYAWDARQLGPMFSNVGTGALIAAIAIGVVLTYRGSGVVNFANGVVSIFVAYWYYGLRMEGKFYVPPLPNPLVLIEIPVNLFREDGDYLDLPNWPTVIDLPGDRLTTASAVVVALGLAVLFGLFLHFAIFNSFSLAFFELSHIFILSGRRRFNGLFIKVFALPPRIQHCIANICVITSAYDGSLRTAVVPLH